jgi:putative SOS response-associated peptidase YedK
MCGRFTLTDPAKGLKDIFPLFDFSELKSRYNIAPTQPVAAVRRDPESGQPALVHLRWGLIPAWADDPAIGNRLINARCETASELPAFRDAVRQRRCLVLADGFYEWHAHGRVRQPHYIRRRDGRPFAFAGLWEHWHRAGQAIDSCTILTTDANELVRPLHDRMPVMLHPRDFQRWLDADGDCASIFRPYPTEEMETYPVSGRVNGPQHDDATCIAAIPEPQPERTLF